MDLDEAEAVGRTLDDGDAPPADPPPAQPPSSRTPAKVAPVRSHSDHDRHGWSIPSSPMAEFTDLIQYLRCLP